MRAGVDDEQLSAALSREVVASLCDPQSGSRLIHRLGQRIGTEARLALAAESLKVTGHCDGLTDLSDEVLDWLAEGISAPAPSELTQAQPGNAIWNRAVLRGARTTTWGQPMLRTAARGCGGCGSAVRNALNRRSRPKCGNRPTYSRLPGAPRRACPCCPPS